MIDSSQYILNPVYCSRVLWPAIREYKLTKGQPMPLPLVLLILPIGLHKRSRKFIFRMQKKGGSISKSINKKGDNPLLSGNDLALGLQSRLDSTIPLTLSALNVGIASQLYQVTISDTSSFPIYSTQLKSLPAELSSETGDDVDDRFKASERLGAWFSNGTIEAIYSALKVSI